MTRILQPPTATEQAPTSAARFIVNDEGKPLYALIDYELYLTLQEDIDDWYADQRAIAAYERYLKDPTGARPWSEIKAELIAKGLLDDDGTALDD